MRNKKWKKIKIWGVFEKNSSDIEFCDLIGLFEYQSWADLICSYLNACWEPKKEFFIKSLKAKFLK